MNRSPESERYPVPKPIVDVLSQVSRLINTLLTSIANGTATPQQVELFLDWFFDMPFVEREEIYRDSRAGEPSLRLISDGKKLHLSPLNGKKKICNATNLFSDIDPHFSQPPTNEQGGPTLATTVLVYEVVEPANFGELFGSIHSDLNTLCLTQHQILHFINLHRWWLHEEGCITFFLVKRHDDFFVVGIGVNSDGSLKASLSSRDNAYLLGTGSKPRLVVPDLS